MTKRPTILQKPVFLHVIFWATVIICYAAANWDNHQDSTEVIITYVVKVALQAMVAYVVLGIIIPVFFAKRNIWQLVFNTSLLLMLLHVIVTSWRQLYLIPTYETTYLECIEKYGHLSFWQHLFSFQTIIFRNSATYFPPTLILIAIQYYDSLYRVASLSDLKKTQELDSLKRQLNPHFLFNTLNNLYSLSLQKSDRVPDIIARLAEIMDYMLYRCDEDFVPLNKEVELIENYIALESVRFGDRIVTTFDTNIKAKPKIAPLLLLTFVENAFKHGVSQEANRAAIDIKLVADNRKVDFCIRNTKPKIQERDSKSRTTIGLNNIKKQLQLLYRDTHELLKVENEDTYQIQLKLHHT